MKPHPRHCDDLCFSFLAAPNSTPGVPITPVDSALANVYENKDFQIQQNHNLLKNLGRGLPGILPAFLKSPSPLQRAAISRLRHSNEPAVVTFH
jgi:hypothetical protein